MKETDEQIDRVLAAMRDADPPPAMERRILDAVKAREAISPRARRTLLSALLPACGALALLLALLLGIVPTQQPHTNTNHNRKTTSQHHDNTAAQAINRENTQPMPAQITHTRNTHTSEAEEADETETLASREMRAPSRPSSSQPLTSQEKLLLQVVQRGDPRQFAMLHAQIQPFGTPEPRAAYPEFFSRPAMGETE